jgi:SAM-dependent methyltransferase
MLPFPNRRATVSRPSAPRRPAAAQLSSAIPALRELPIGCGTGQMSSRGLTGLVIAADLSRSSLLLGAAAARRFGISQAHFVETDLHRSALKSGAFDVVYSSGVLHHTSNPRAAFVEVARLARRGGIVIVGVYNAVARIPLRLRRHVARATHFRIVPFDPVLRERRHEPARRDAWLRDQYQHPEEHSHTVAEIQRWFADNDVDYLRSFPSTVLDDDSEDLFARAVDDWRVERWIAQLGWMWTLGGEGAVLCDSPVNAALNSKRVEQSAREQPSPPLRNIVGWLPGPTGRAGCEIGIPHSLPPGGSPASMA